MSCYNIVAAYFLWICKRRRHIDHHSLNVTMVKCSRACNGTRTHGVTRIYLAARFVIVWDSSMGRDNRHRFKRRPLDYFSDIFDIYRQFRRFKINFEYGGEFNFLDLFILLRDLSDSLPISSEIFIFDSRSFVDRKDFFL